ncbi:MAG: hypothetical protein ACLFV3_09265 [Phycisphaeraceae bacterium]
MPRRPRHPALRPPIAGRVRSPWPRPGWITVAMAGAVGLALGAAASLLLAG